MLNIIKYCLSMVSGIKVGGWWCVGLRLVVGGLWAASYYCYPSETNLPPLPHSSLPSETNLPPTALQPPTLIPPGNKKQPCMWQG